MSDAWNSIGWLEAAVLLTTLGAVFVRFVREPQMAWKWGVFISGLALFCVLQAAGIHFTRDGTGSTPSAHWQRQHFGRVLFSLDEINVVLVPLVALLHFLTALATSRTKMRQFSMSWSLFSETIGLLIFACLDSTTLVGLLILGTLLPYLELRNRQQPTRIYALHLGLFIGLLIVGWAGQQLPAVSGVPSSWATMALTAAVLIRVGTVPAHCWVTDWLAHASFGNALLFVTPLTGVYSALRLVLPTAPDWALSLVSWCSVITVLYTAGMAVVQTDPRKFFAYLFLSHASLVLVGIEMHSSVALTGALAMWLSVSLALTGLALCLRALEARVGSLNLAKFHGLYEHSPALAVCFLVTGFACVGFPGTIGFVAAEVLVEGVIEGNVLFGVVVVMAAAINGIAILRAYLSLFTGTRHHSTVALGITRRERVAVLTLAALILGGGLFPQPGMASRFRAASFILQSRATQVGGPLQQAESQPSVFGLDLE